MPRSSSSGCSGQLAAVAALSAGQLPELKLVSVTCSQLGDGDARQSPTCCYYSYLPPRCRPAGGRGSEFMPGKATLRDL